MTVHQLVKRGLALVLKEYGRWRVSRISLRNLEMSDRCNCVLGQLQGSYIYGRKRLGLDKGSPYGFDQNAEVHPYNSDQLTEAWKKAIRRLR